MKKLRMLLIFAMLLLFTGCQKEQLPEETDALTEEQQAEKKENLEKALGDLIIEPNDALMMVISKSWDVIGTEDVYVLNRDGSGTLNGEEISYECGFDEQSRILVSITQGEVTETYTLTSDKSGYGLELTSVEDGKNLSFFPTGYALLEVSDDRVYGLVGEWKDDNQNVYVMNEDSTIILKGKEADTPGNWYAIEKEGVLCFAISVEGGSLEFEYELQEEGQTIALYDRAAEVWHYWRR